jgi:hypothetical protein
MNVIKAPEKPHQNRITSALDVECWMLDVGCSRFFVVLALVFLTTIAGCGKKAPPTPPGVAPIPTVSDLSYEVDGAGVHLEWTVPMDMAGGEAIVSRAGIKLSDDMCDDCPLVFQKVAAVPIYEQGSALKQAHRDSPSPGYRYTYRIVLKTDDGRTSAASNLVTFDY